VTRTAVLIGVNGYDHSAFTDLTSPFADVEAIRRSLEHNGSFDRILPLRNPTRTETMEVLDEVFSDGKPDDLVFVTFSGHGTKDRKGNLHLAVRDSHPKRLMSSAISAADLQRLLRDTRVRKKVLLLDCCHGGAFADGFGTRGVDDGADEIDIRRQLKDAQGSYVLAASGAIEKAHEGDNTAGSRPSVFSGAVAEGLAGHAPDGDGDGWIGPTDLYLYVSGVLGRDGRQTPSVFTDGLQGRIHLARHIGAATAVPLDGAAAPRGHSGPPEAAAAVSRSAADSPRRRSTGADAPFDLGQWTALLTYYASCLQRESALQQLPEAKGTRFAVCDMKYEVLLSGAEPRWRATGRAAELAREAHRSGQTLRYGYPAVLVDAAPGGGSRDRRVAPLFVIDVDVAVEDHAVHLLPVGEPQIHDGLLRTAAGLSADAADELAAAFEADWSGKGVAGLGDKARAVLSELGLPRADLRPGELEARLRIQRTAAGAQNVAMLHVADTTGGASRALVQDLSVGQRYALPVEKIASTALGALSDPEPSEAGAPNPRPVVTGPGNDSQEAVRTAAMKRRLTVATGAPGTGKSELITSVVTTAVAAGESVLVASTNNGAVDEVVSRVNRLLPEADLIVRTGNKDKQQNEAGILDTMLQARFDPVDTATAAERIDAHERRVAQARTVITEVAEAERELAVLAPVHRRDKARLPAGTRMDAFPSADDARRWAHRTDRALNSRWTGWWHRWRVSRTLAIPGDDESLAAVARFLDVHAEWLEARGRAGMADEARHAHERIGGVRGESRADSALYLRGRVAQALTEGRPAIEARRQALAEAAATDRGTGTWKALERVLRSVRAWATTSRSVRVFPPNPGLFDLVVIDEAGQCTVADLVPLLFRAKRALVIGDPHQLQPVNPLKGRDDRHLQESAGLDEQWLDDRSLVFSRSSAYAAAAAAVAAAGDEILWLDEHYRCHPDIVGPVNRRFYGDRLAVRTDPRSLTVRGGDAVEWIDVRGVTDRPNGYSCRNSEEAMAVRKLLRQLWTDLPKDARIGVVSPFAAQVRHLQHLLGDKAGDRITVGTVHTFQGRECDVIVVSPTAAEGVRKRTGQWADSQQNLWNVAITRARARLYIVGDKGYWAARGGVLGDLATASGHVGGGGDRNEARSLLFTALMDAGARPRRGERVDGYACDLTAAARDGQVGVVIDGAGLDDPNAGPAGRVLQRALDRAALLERVTGTRVVRVPAWRCLAEPEAVAAEFAGD
jgi:hypothetical protein